MYFALLSSLAKAILLQAETEVTAEKRSAAPLAQVAVNLLGELDGFAEAFWAKLCQRVGGWTIPIVVPPTDVDGTQFNEVQRAKALGYRDTNEPLADYITRVSGIMRVYFHIVCGSLAKPLHPAVRLPRYWTYISRMLSDTQLLETAVAPSVLHGIYLSFYIPGLYVLITFTSCIGSGWYSSPKFLGSPVDQTPCSPLRGGDYRYRRRG